MTAPVGVLLAGGASRRMGASKAVAVLAGRPLLHHPLAALESVVADLAVVAKRDTPLPDVEGRAEVWIEPEAGHHPLFGLREALRRAAGRTVLVVPADLPLLAPDDLRMLLATPANGRSVIATAGGRPQPLLGLHPAAALAVLEAMAPDEAARTVIERLDPVLVELGEEACMNVNTPADLARAAALLSRR